jgi:glycosyltransferase involved in cell wall biosynthesis
MKHYINQFNKSDTLGVISLYPKKGELYSTGTSGIASFTKNTVAHIENRSVIFAEYIKSPVEYREGDSLVNRCFKKNSPLLWLDLIKALKKYPEVKTLLIQFDFALYGDILTSCLFLPFLGILKLFGYKTTVQIHSVVNNVFKLYGHIGLSNDVIGKIKGSILNVIFKSFYIALGLFSTQIVVSEETLKHKLSTFIPHNKVAVIPHGVDTDLTPMNKAEARKALGISDDEHVVMFFGFVNWFKGADLFVKAYKNTSHLLGKKARFIIAGGESATLKNKAYYKEYFADTVYSIEESKSVNMTGFVPQEKIQQYFSAADLVVFPYRYFMSASGVLSLVFSYKKPFIISSELSQMFTSEDMSTALETVGLDKKDITFNLNTKSCLEVTEKVLRNGLKQKMIDMASYLRVTRSWKKIGAQYQEKIFSPTYMLDTTSSVPLSKFAV